ncbi:hypothetical protein CHLRE_16g677738v5 [Chlamydomonas reinhardtii]|mgnify:CR=1 FL=1|uniref:Uncharacterized protein n=1 Tax=Chlamydomonas reinhardtii TaxID=3055 RepID=A0A2K3CU05_CHLRE|nr:uncharacterized protein CHLRE_16g677738v5 [Chlamydomonas reinhardtii]PNW71768.1 hypothetical protein CHLRE_16g677738v5 [Chlamydomonas reinhardtii]
MSGPGAGAGGSGSIAGMGSGGINDAMLAGQPGGSVPSPPHIAAARGDRGQWCGRVSTAVKLPAAAPPMHLRAPAVTDATRSLALQLGELASVVALSGIAKVSCCSVLQQRQQQQQQQQGMSRATGDGVGTGVRSGCCTALAAARRAAVAVVVVAVVEAAAAAAEAAGLVACYI